MGYGLKNNMEEEISTFKDIATVDSSISELVRKWRNSEDVRKYMYIDHTITKEEHDRWLNSLIGKKDRKTWVVYSDKYPVGIAQLSYIDFDNKNAEWGVYIGDNHFRGIGLGSRILITLINYVFDEIKFNRMHTRVLANNSSALKLYEKLGFQKEGILRKHLYRDGEYLDIVIMGILKEEWNAIKAGFTSNKVIIE